MSDFASDVLNQHRYVTDAKRILIAWLKHHLNDPDGPYRAQWRRLGAGEVAVCTARALPALRPGDQFPSPFLVLSRSGEESKLTTLNIAQYNRYGQIQRMQFGLSALTDGNTGREIACDDLSSAVGKVIAEHRQELVPLGLQITSFTGASEVGGVQDDRYENSCQLEVEVLLTGATKSTVECELARFVITRPGNGDFFAGTTLELAHDLCLKTLAGTHPPAIEVTVYAKNQDGDPGTLTGTIPGAVAAGTRIDLVAAQEDDQFTQVTSIAITGGSAGDSFKVVNIPQQLE